MGNACWLASANCTSSRIVACPTNPCSHWAACRLQAYCSGDSFGMGGSAVTIEGGTFINNEALEVGGALVAWGTTTVVTVKGGLFRNNSAK